MLIICTKVPTTGSNFGSGIWHPKRCRFPAPECPNPGTCRVPAMWLRTSGGLAAVGLQSRGELPAVWRLLPAVAWLSGCGLPAIWRLSVCSPVAVWMPYGCNMAAAWLEAACSRPRVSLQLGCSPHIDWNPTTSTCAACNIRVDYRHTCAARTVQ